MKRIVIGLELRLAHGRIEGVALRPQVLEMDERQQYRDAQKHRRELEGGNRAVHLADLAARRLTQRPTQTLHGGEGYSTPLMYASERLPQAQIYHIS